MTLKVVYADNNKVIIDWNGEKY